MLFSSVAQLCPTLCNPMGCSMPGFPVHQQHPELVQTLVLSDAIQPSHPLLSPFPPASNLSQHQGFFNESVLHIRWPKYWRFRGNSSSKKIQLPIQETQKIWVWSLGEEDLEKGIATHSSILAWKKPWRKEPSKLQSMRSQRVWSDWVTEHAHTIM